MPKWLLEAIGVCVSSINNCDYCLEHHYEGMRKLLNDEERSKNIRIALVRCKAEEVFEGIELAAIMYSVNLTLTPEKISLNVFEGLRDTGLDEGQILEINQVAAYFAYANRMVLGLGVKEDGDIIGLSPNDSDDIDNWSHS